MTSPVLNRQRDVASAALFRHHPLPARHPDTAVVAANPVAAVHTHNDPGATSPETPESCSAQRATSNAAKPTTSAAPSRVGLHRLRRTRTHPNATAATISTLSGSQPCINDGLPPCAFTTTPLLAS